jgi:hypothetical protein
MMSLKEVKRQLWEGIYKAIRNIVFVFDRMEQEFVRKIPGGKQIFFVRVIQRPAGEIMVEPWWSIQIDEILAIYNQVNSKEKRFHSSACVFESTLENCCSM